MPRTVILKITQSDKDAAYLRSLSESSKLAKKCVYVGTYSERFILCYEKHCGKFIYYAVDMFSGNFSRIYESSFQFSESAIVREMGSALVNAVKHTGCFNRIHSSDRPRSRVWGTVSSL